MHIALIANHYTLKKGGAERYCVNLARTLAQAGHRVSVLAQSIDAELKGENEFLPVKVNRISSWKRIQSFDENTQKLLKQHHFEHIVGLCNTPHADLVRVTGRIHAHWMGLRYTNRWHHQLQRLNPRHRAILNLEKRTFTNPNTRWYIAQSTLEKELLVQYYQVPAEKIRVIYNGVDQTTFSPHHSEDAWQIRHDLGTPHNALLCLFAATCDFENKGLKTVLKALSQCHDKTLHLAVLGNGNLRKFTSLAKKLGVVDRVIFRRRQRNIQHFYAAGDLFVFPTLYEPFPNVNLEAMASGTPIITSRTCGGKDLVQEGKNGYTIRDGNAVEELVAKINHFTGLSQTERQKMSFASCQRASQFQLRENAQKITDLLLSPKDSAKASPRPPFAA
ncbi:MAG: glycosyltransferase family 4 protein [Pirellulaceae bacterium]|nr:glycosyltransferase family 4 protein [Pirellulaceae bacterium]